MCPRRYYVRAPILAACAHRQVADFGLSARSSKDDLLVDSVGTPSYAAPEMFVRRRPHDGRKAPPPCLTRSLGGHRVGARARGGRSAGRLGLHSSAHSTQGIDLHIRDDLEGGRVSLDCARSLPAEWLGKAPPLSVGIRGGVRGCLPMRQRNAPGRCLRGVEVGRYPPRREQRRRQRTPQVTVRGVGQPLAVLRAPPRLVGDVGAVFDDEPRRGVGPGRPEEGRQLGPVRKL